MNDQTIQQGLDVAKGIGDYGMMAISAIEIEKIS